MKTPKFGIVGCGNISRFHFNGLKKAGAEIVHVADINEAAARPYVEEFGAKYSESYKKLLEDPDVSVVSVLTSKLHKEICLEALKAGKDIICEKTMMNNAEDAEEVAKATLASGQLFFTAFMKRFFPAAQKAKELIPGIGKIYSAQIRSYQNWGINFYEMDNADAYNHVLQSYGGAVIKCAGSHMIDMTLWLLGRPQSLYTHIDYVPNSKFDRKAVALFEYDNGMTASFETAIHTLDKVGYERNSWDEWIEIHGVDGRLKLYTVMWDHPENNPALLVHYDNRTGSTTEYTFNISNPFDSEMAFMVDCLKNRKDEAPNVIDGFNVDVIIQAMTESAKKKSSIKIDWRGL